MKTIRFIIALSLFLFFFPGKGLAGENDFYVIKVSGSINPAVAEFLEKGISKASADEVSCIIVEMDTPGGLAESMREIVKAIFASKVPVVVYVRSGGE